MRYPTFVSFLIIALTISCHSYRLNIQKKSNAHILNLVDSLQFSGAVLIADGNGIILKKGFGYSNIKNRTKNKPDTKFRIGSITKQFTSMLVMQLVQSGKLNLDEKIKDLLPELKLNSETSVRFLLNHTSGIKDYTEVDYQCNEQSQSPIIPKQFAICFESLGQDFIPGEKWSYSNSNYYILGLLLEKLYEDKFENILSQMILVPLQMQSTGYIINNDALASGYKSKDSSLIEATISDIGLAYSAGGMYSTLEDLYKWNLALSNYALLDKTLTNEMLAQNTSVDPSFYGYGWFVDHHWKYKEYRTFHEGGIDGFSSCIDRYPESNICIIVLSNFEFTNSREQLTDPIADFLFRSRNEKD